MTRLSVEHNTGLALAQYAAQPLFDTAKRRVALELLQRNKTATVPLMLDNVSSDDLAAQCQQLSDYMVPYRTVLLLRLSLPLLLARKTLALEPARVVLALDAPAPASPALLSAIVHYKAQGFRFLLDDACADTDSPALIALADIIRIDMARTQLTDIERHKALYSRPGLLWLADKVETDAQFALYKSLGCDWFQGYFLPDKLTVAGKQIEPSALKLAEIIACLFVEEPDINTLTALLQDEPAIVIGLLKLANSPLYRKTRAVSSIKEMVTRLGLTLARKWVLTYAVLSGTSAAAAITVLTRAHCCQRIAAQWQLGQPQEQQYFLAGLISGTDMLFGVDSEAFLAKLNISSSIKQALRNNSGRIAEALTLVRAIERGYALGINASAAELPYQMLYQQELAEVQQRLAQAGY